MCLSALKNQVQERGIAGVTSMTQEVHSQLYQAISKYLNFAPDSYRRENKKHHREDHRVDTRAKRERRYNGSEFHPRAYDDAEIRLFRCLQSRSEKSRIESLFRIGCVA